MKLRWYGHVSVAAFMTSDSRAHFPMGRKSYSSIRGVISLARGGVAEITGTKAPRIIVPKPSSAKLPALQKFSQEHLLGAIDRVYHFI
jgi:hypothetical protein